MSEFSVLYPISEGSCNGLTIEGEECERSLDGGFLVPSKHVADVLAFIPGLTREKPSDATQVETTEGKKRGRPAKATKETAPESDANQVEA